MRSGGLGLDGQLELSIGSNRSDRPVEDFKAEQAHLVAAATKLPGTCLLSARTISATVQFHQPDCICVCVDAIPWGCDSHFGSDSDQPMQFATVLGLLLGISHGVMLVELRQLDAGGSFHEVRYSPTLN